LVDTSLLRRHRLGVLLNFYDRAASWRVRVNDGTLRRHVTTIARCCSLRKSTLMRSS